MDKNGVLKYNYLAFRTEVLKIKQTKWLIRLYLPFVVFYLLCGLIFAIFIYLMNLLNIGESLISAWKHIPTWGSLVLVYLIFGISSLYWYVRKIIAPMYPNDLKQQRKTLHIGGLGLYMVWLVCFIGLLGTSIGSILYLTLGPRFLRSFGSQTSSKSQTNE